MAIPGAFLTSQWRKEILNRKRVFSTGFCICEQENFSFTPQENISLWFHEVRETRLDVIIKSAGIQRLRFEVLELPFLPKQVSYPTHNFKN